MLFANVLHHPKTAPRGTRATYAVGRRATASVDDAADRHEAADSGARGRRHPSRPAAPWTAQLAWPLSLALCTVDALWIWRAGWRVGQHDLLILLAALAGLQLPLLLGRYRRVPRIAQTLRTACLLLVFQAGAACLSYLLISTAPPLVDAALARGDVLLGFHWPDLAAAQQTLPIAVQALLRLAYQSGLPQILLVVLLLGFTGRVDQLRDFMGRYIVLTLTVVLLSAPWPAAGAFKFFDAASPQVAADLWHFEALRNGSLHRLDLSQMQGLISMPSLHAAMAVLLAWALRGTALQWPGLLLNLLMLAATPVLGGHYVVDVLAGVALAVLAIALPARSTAAAPAPAATGWPTESAWPSDSAWPGLSVAATVTVSSDDEEDESTHWPRRPHQE